MDSPDFELLYCLLWAVASLEKYLFPQKPPQEPLSAITPTLLQSSTLTEPLSFHRHTPSLSAIIASNLHRATTLTPLVNRIQLHAQITQETLTSGCFLDTKARELEEYITTSLDSASWETVEAQDSIEIAVLEGSKYQAELCVYRITVDLSPIVKANFLLAMLDNPDFRTQWDLTVREMTVVYVAEENAYLRSYIQRWDPRLEEREYVEKCQVKMLRGEIRQVFYSIEDPVLPIQDFPRKVRFLRAHTYFGLVQIFEAEESLTLRITKQCDALQNSWDVESDLNNLFEWVVHLREVVESRSF